MRNGITHRAIFQIRKLFLPRWAFKFAGLNISPLFFSLSASIILVMSQSFKLFRLQQIDNQIDKAKARLREIEIELQENSELRQANQRMEQTCQFIEETEKALRKAETEVLAQRIKIEHTVAALYGGYVKIVFYLKFF
jgi:cell shape-determining protein MreC